MWPWEQHSGMTEIPFLQHTENLETFPPSAVLSLPEPEPLTGAGALEKLLWGWESSLLSQTLWLILAAG